MAAAVTLVLMAAVAAYVWSARALVVDAVQVQSAPLVRSVQFSARVEALSRVDIGSTVTGRVAEVLQAVKEVGGYRSVLIISHLEAVAGAVSVTAEVRREEGATCSTLRFGAEPM